MNDVTRSDSSRRVHQPPASIEQARAQVVAQMDHLEANCRDGIDITYAVRCLDEALGDYCAIVLGQ